MKIKTKLLTQIGGSIILLLAVAFTILVLIISDKLTKQLHEQLETRTNNIAKQVEDLITTSAKSYLTAIGDKSESITETFSYLARENELSEARALELALNSLTEYKFLKSGYIFVTDNRGIIIAHPDATKIGTIAPVQAWIQRLKPNERVFKEYEESGKNKLVYRTYNREFDFNICVSTNTSEFLYAVDITELNKTLNTIVIGKTGYPFLLNSEGYAITEPNKENLNRNILNDQDINNDKIYSRVLNEPEGLFTYKTFDTKGNIREKFIAFKTEPHSELVIVLTGYSNEIFDLVNVIITFILILGVVLFVILFIVIYVVSSKVTTPIAELTQKIINISHGNGDLTKRIKIESKDEIGIMVENFNFFLDNLQHMVGDIKESILMTSETKDKIIYRVHETSASVKKISANIISIKNHTKQIGNDTSEELKEYVIKSMDNIVGGSNKILNSMEKITQSSEDLKYYSDKLNRRVNRLTT